MTAGAAPAERPQPRPASGAPCRHQPRSAAPAPPLCPPLGPRGPSFAPPGRDGGGPAAPPATHGGAGAGPSRGERWAGREGAGGPVRRLSRSEIFQPYLTRKYGSPGEKRLTRALLKSNSSACCAGKIALAASQRAGTRNAEGKQMHNQIATL